MRTSNALIIQRCLAMLRRLQRGPATKDELIAAVRAAMPPDDPYEGASGKALNKRLDTYKKNLDQIFNVDWTYSQATGQYTLGYIWEPSLDLPDEALGAIAFLQETFEPDAPNYESVQHFLSLIVSCLSPERRGDLDRQRSTLDMTWGPRDNDAIDLRVEQKLYKARTQHRLVAFDYYSPTYEHGASKRHIVEPWERYFDSAWGHHYLHGYCRRILSNDGQSREPRTYIRYRMGRIRNVTVLPDKLPPTRPSVPRRELRYRLAPEIARYGEVTHHPGIDILQTERQADGSIIVHAETESVWWAVRALLHYGATCQVLGGPEALAEMRTIVQGMAEAYGLLG